MDSLGKRFVGFAFLAIFVLAGFGVTAETANADDRGLRSDRHIADARHADARGNSRDGESSHPGVAQNIAQGTGDTFVDGIPAKAAQMKMAAMDQKRDQNAAAPKPWSIATYTGDVRVRVAKGAQWKPLAKATDRIAPGMQVKTGANGQFVLKQDKDILTISPNSQIEVPAKGDNNILQTLGSVLFDMEKRPGRRFSVGTPYLAAVIKGTIFTVTVDALGGSVDVHEGAVQVASLKSGTTMMVRPGRKATVTAKNNGQMTVGKGSGLKARKSSRLLKNKNGGGQLKSKKGKTQLHRIESTLGVGKINVANATMGLVANWGPKTGGFGSNPGVGSAASNPGGGNAGGNPGVGNAGGNPGVGSAASNPGVGSAASNPGGGNAGGNPGVGSAASNPGGGNAGGNPGVGSAASNPGSANAGGGNAGGNGKGKGKT